MTAPASPLRAVSEALAAAARAAPGIRVYTDPGVPVDPPGVLIGPPALRWDAMCPQPTSATVIVYLMVPADSRAIDRLWDLVPVVTAALDQRPDAVVMSARPGVFVTGGTELPCYEITTDVTL